MLKSELSTIFFKYNKNEQGFLLVVFNTSEGLFELDSCNLKKIDSIPQDYEIYDRSYYNPSNLQSVSIVNVLYNDEMDFIVILDNNQVVIIGADNNFNNDSFSQKIEVYNFESLAKEYLDSTEDYY